MTLPPPIDWRDAGIGPGPDVPPERRVTRDNWRLWPYSRWAFQHARELVPSRALPRATVPRPLPERPVDLSGLVFADEVGATIGWEEFLERSYTEALIVLHGQAIVFEHYANGMTAATPHMGFSITKSLVGLVAERMIAAGLVDPAVRAGDLVPELAPSGFADPSLPHLLDMTDGTAFEEDYANRQADVHLYSAAYWTPAVGLGGTLEALARLSRREAALGGAFRYRTPVGDVVGWMLRRACRRPLADLVAEQLWLPAGCADDAYMLVDTAGIEMAGTGFNATARDLARVALWLTDPAQAALLAGLLAGGDRGLFDAAAPPERQGGSYRSFWWIDHGQVPTVAANGVFGQRIWIAPARDLIVVRFGAHPVAGNSATEMLHRNAFAALDRALA